LFKDPLTEHCKKMNCKARVSFLGEKRDRKFVKISDGNYAFKTTVSFSYSLFPLEEGELQLGTLKINYFNPNSETYEESSLTFPTLKVLPKPALSQNEVEKETDNLFLPLLLLLLIGSASFLIYNFREDLISLFKTLKIPKVLKLGAVNRDLEILDKLIGNKNGILLKNYLLSKNFDTKLISKILELKSENPNKKMVDIYRALKKEDKEELSKLIQEQFSKGEKL
ncbi:MAG: hypothetical protein N3A69_16520, partial [Leptospiraceae bacterium]|nr:hypothetical protein [Leptospiraceae bacterium]